MLNEAYQRVATLHYSLLVSSNCCNLLWSLLRSALLR